MSQIKAPWTQEQVDALNAWQASDYVHPFTCGNRHTPEHKIYAQQHGQGDHGILVATPEGWKCPVCDYVQDWAHDFMFSPAACDDMRALIEALRGGVPRNCDFCQQPKLAAELHPEEAGQWICNDCIAKDPKAYYGK